MNIVIVGAKERNLESDRVYVEDLIEANCEKYPGCIIVTALTRNGIGKFVKEYCLTLSASGKQRYPLIEQDVKIYAENLSKREQSEIYLSRNATLLELGHVFYYLASENRRGQMEELISRVQEAKRPFRILLPDSEIELI